MRMINSVRGPISTEEFGGVLSHEHIIFGYPGWIGDLSHDGFKVEDTIEMVKAMMADLGPYNIKTIVDPTPNECGRSVADLKKVAEALDLNIIVGSGYYYQGEGSPAYFHIRQLGGCDIDAEIRSIFEKEFYEGIEGTGIKAGVLKLASSYEGITDYEKHFFEAACDLARNDKNIRIITHLTAGGAMKDQADFFRSHGVDPQQVTLGHACGNGDMDLQIELAKEGFYLGYDRIGLANFGGAPSDETRVERLNTLHKAGVAGQITVSTDRVLHYKGREVTADPEISKAITGNQYWGRIFDFVIPNLKEAGWSDKETEALYTKNVVKFFDNY